MAHQHIINHSLPYWKEYTGDNVTVHGKFAAYLHVHHTMHTAITSFTRRIWLRWLTLNQQCQSKDLKSTGFTLSWSSDWRHATLAFQYQYL